MVPLLSIIVPVYNVEKYLAECVDSILTQPFRDFELLLVNDGSTDTSPEICKRYEYIDPRVKVIDKKNGGLSSARNAGLSCAKGKYISFIDSDDYLSGDYYSKAVEELENDLSIDMVWLQYIIAKGEQKEYHSNSSEPLAVESKRELLDLFTSKEAFAWLKVYRSSVFKTTRYPEGRILEDMYILPDLLDNVRKCKVIPISGYYIYRQREGSICHTKHTAKMIDDIAVASSRKISMCASIDRDIYVKMLATYSSAYLNAEVLFPRNDWKNLKAIYSKFDFTMSEAMKANISIGQKVKLGLIKAFGFDGFSGIYKLIYRIRRFNV